jgi:hypothetical protein
LSLWRGSEGDRLKPVGLLLVCIAKELSSFVRESAGVRPAGRLIA